MKYGYECDMHFAMRRFRATELEIVSGIVTYDKMRKTAREVTNASVSLRSFLRTSNEQESLKDHYLHISELCREQARKCLEGFMLPTDYTAMQIVAVHAYLLTFSPQFVQLWDKQGVHNLLGPHSPDESDLLRPK